MLMQMTIALLLGLAPLVQPVEEPDPPPVDIQLQLVKFSPAAEDPALGTLFGDNPEGEALLSIPGVTMQSPVKALFVDRDHYTLTCRGTNIETLLKSAATRDIVQQLTAPRVLVLPKQEASVRVGQPISYLQRSADGCLEVVQDDEQSEGISITLLVSRASSQQIVFERITVEISEVLSRQPIEGVPFDVGRPVITTRSAKMELTLAPDQVGVFPVPSAGTDDLPVLLFLTACQADAGRTSGR